MPTNLKNMSRKELLKLQKDVEKALKAADERNRAEARKAAEKAVAAFGVSLTDVATSPAPRKSKPKKQSSPPKYRNPNNPEQTWTGKGRKPRWFNEAVEAGVDIESMAI